MDNHDRKSPFDDSTELGLRANEAVAGAINKSLNQNVPIVYAKDGVVWREYPDGHLEQVSLDDEGINACLPALGVLDLLTDQPLQPTTPGKKIVRIFAGPNGSGKSTIYEFISRNYESGCFVNADIIAVDLEKDGFFALSKYGIKLPKEVVLNTLNQSSWGWEDLGNFIIRSMTVDDDLNIYVNHDKLGYQAAIIADLARMLLIKEGRHFSLETVMSHPSKVEFMWDAINSGYTCYLYFICTESPMINLERVRARVRQGGHDVPSDSITSRYYRSLQLLRSAIDLSYRAFLFDNSAKIEPKNIETNNLLCLEFLEGRLIHRFRRELPAWVEEFTAISDQECKTA